MTKTMSLPSTEPGAFDLVRPFVWLALAAFLTGFSIYLILGTHPAPPRSAASPASYFADAAGLRSPGR